MRFVEEAMAQGWEVVLPVQRMTHDYRAILMRRKRTDGRLELGFALEGKTSGSQNPRARS